jgi:UPF0271 protein
VRETLVILLNCDMGESFGIWRLGDDQRIMPSIHIANIACAFHASDFNLEAEGMSLNHLKPHDSLYGMAARGAEVANAICDAADVFKTPILGMINAEHERVYKGRGHRFIAEFYVDLDYADDGGLIITREHEPVEPAVAADRAVRALREGLVRSVGGKDVHVAAGTICVHSDTPGADLVAKAVHDRLVSEGFNSARPVSR